MNFYPNHLFEEPLKVFMFSEPAIDVSAFLTKIGSVLATTTHAYQGVTYTTGQAIKMACKESFPHVPPRRPEATVPYCSPQFLLAMVQKEQGLLSIGPTKALALKVIPAKMKLCNFGGAGVEHIFWTNALQKRLDYCLGYGCRDKETREDYPAWSESKRGFVVQLRHCARRMRELQMGWHLGKELSVQPFDKDAMGFPNTWIVPKDALTYACYEYNPRIEGAYNLVKIYNQFFGG